MSTPPTIIVPARLGSTRFPRKLLHPVRGKPILLWTAERIREQAPGFPLYFAVDHQELREVLEDNGFTAIQTRPDHPSGTDRLAEASRALGAESVINVQGDEPLISGRQIRLLAHGLEQDAAMATLATPIRTTGELNDPNHVKVVRDRTGGALYFSRAPIPFARDNPGGAVGEGPAAPGAYRHLGLYAYKAGFLRTFTSLEPGFLENTERLEQLRALEHGYRIHVGITEETTIGIDTPGDLARFEASLPA